MLIIRYQIFQSHQTKLQQMAQLLEYDSFPESDGFFYSSEETDFIIMGIYRIHPYVTTKQEQILSRG